MTNLIRVVSVHLNNSSFLLVCWCCVTDVYHSKVGDTRPRVFERTVSFGDSVQVRE